MASLTISPSGQKRDFPNSTKLLDALLDMGIVLKTPCGGRGICGKCRTRVNGAFSAKTDAEQKVTGNDIRLRLACQTQFSGDTTVFINEKLVSGHKVYPAVSSDGQYAIAVDIGTTSVNITLLNLSEGKQFDLSSFLNPQRQFGHDVISRIATAADPESAKTMTRQVLKILQLLTLKQAYFPMQRLKFFRLSALFWAVIFLADLRSHIKRVIVKTRFLLIWAQTVKCF